MGHGLFGGHKSEDIRTFFSKTIITYLMNKCRHFLSNQTLKAGQSTEYAI